MKLTVLESTKAPVQRDVHPFKRARIMFVDAARHVLFDVFHRQNFHNNSILVFAVCLSQSYIDGLVLQQHLFAFYLQVCASPHTQVITPGNSYLASSILRETNQSFLLCKSLQVVNSLF